MVNENYTNVAYNSFLEARKLPMNIVDYLFYNSQELWKLLYYPQSTLNQPDVSNSIKAKMIAKTATGDLSKYQVFFETYNTDATLLADAQLRVVVLEVQPTDRTHALVNILVQCIVSNKSSVISTDIAPVESKGFAIAQEVARVLNGAKLSGIKGALWLDRREDSRTGIRKVGYSDNFSGYEVLLGAYI